MQGTHILRGRPVNIDAPEKLSVGHARSASSLPAMLHNRVCAARTRTPGSCRSTTRALAIQASSPS
jgi:hypothetical protein